MGRKGQKQRRAGEQQSEVLRDIPIACTDERKAVEFLEKQRWGDKPECPHCGSKDVYQMKDAKTGDRNKGPLWRCHSCKKQYSVRIGTVLQDSRIPLRHWCFAFWRACASKKGIPAKQIQREIHVTYKSALFLMHRIRAAMADDGPKLTGTVEVDETYVGGKPRRGEPRRWGRGTKKQPVMALVSRDGNAHAEVIPDVTAKTLKTAIRENVDASARICTDEWRSYFGIGKDFEGGHQIVAHSKGEYSRGDVHTNTAECFFSLIKRGMMGTFHSVSKRHLHRYVSEFQFRWNSRKVDDGERIRRAVRGAEGKRLRYREPMEN